MECYANLERRSNAADVWAMATTLYEIFTYGKEMPQTDHMQTKRVKYRIVTKRFENNSFVLVVLNG